MNLQESPDYNRIRAALRVDMLRIDEDLAELPPLVQEAAEFAADAIRARDLAKLQIDIEQADAAHELRADFIAAQEKFTEKQIEQEMARDKKVIEAQRAYEDLRHSAALWASLVEGLRTKVKALDNTAQLLLSGFLTPNAIKQGRREELHQRRLSRQQS